MSWTVEMALNIQGLHSHDAVSTRVNMLSAKPVSVQKQPQHFISPTKSIYFNSKADSETPIRADSPLNP